MTNAMTVVVITVVIFLICRELMCWYWKINKKIELLEQILHELKKSNSDKSDVSKVA